MKYKFWATLLDTFNYYLNDTDGDSFYTENKIIETINRTTPVTNAMTAGKEFHELLADGKEYKQDILINGTTCKAGIINHFRNIIGIDNAIAERYTELILPNDVKIYGYVDFINIVNYEIKTTSRYTFNKYKKALQHKIYCAANGIDTCVYLINHWNDYATETYTIQDMEQTINELVEVTENLKQFIDLNKNKIDFKHIKY